MVEAGSDAVVLAEVAAELQAMHARVGSGETLDDSPGIVAAAILDKHDLEGGRHGFEGETQAAIQFVEDAFGFVDGNDD